MKKLNSTKLALRGETIARLDTLSLAALAKVQGGRPASDQRTVCSDDCHLPSGNGACTVG